MPEFRDRTVEQRQRRQRRVVETPPSTIPTPVAANRAMAESLVLNDAAVIPQLLEQNLSGNVVDQGIRQIYGELMTKEMQESFEQDILSAPDDETKLQIVNEYYTTVNKQDASIRTISLMGFLNSVDPEARTLDNYDKYNYLLSPGDIDILRKRISERGAQSLRNILEYANVDFGDKNLFEVMGEAGKLLVLPFQEIGLNNIVESALAPMGIEVDSLWFPGSVRQDIREVLANLPEDQLLEAVNRIDMAFRAAEAHPIMGKILSDYNITDFYNSVLSEAVVLGKESGDTFDTWINNLITSVELVGLAGAVAGSVGRSRPLRTALEDGVRTEATNVASEVGSSRANSLLQQVTDLPEVRGVFEVDEASAISQRLPKPLGTDVRSMPEPIRDELGDVQRLQDQYVDLAAGAHRQIIPIERQVDLLQQEMRTLQQIATPVVRVEMSRLGINADESGYTVRAVLGATEESGWKDVSDALRTARRLDPEGLNVEVLRVGDNGSLEPVFTTREELLQGYRNVDAIDADDLEPFTGTRPEFRNEFFLRYEQERFWHPADAVAFGDSPVLRSGGVTRWLFPPSSIINPDIFRGAINNYLMEQGLVRRTEQILSPFFRLNNQDKTAVMHTLDFVEDFARRENRVPTSAEILSEYPELTANQLRGYTSVRSGLDAMYSSLNQRLYREWKQQGFITAHTDTGATYHGKPLELDQARNSRTYFDPVERKPVQLAEEELEELYNRGGRIVETDIPVETPRAQSQKFNRILIDPEAGYEIRALSTTPLQYTPGYTLRIYNDPYFIVKRYRDGVITRNGQSVRRRGVNDPAYTSVIRTAGSFQEAEDLVNSANIRLGERGERGTRYTYEVVRAQDLSIQERTAAVKDLLYREGRLFWDNRRKVPMRNINGSRATIMDPVRSLERAISAIARQNTQEDWMRSLKTSFMEQYSDLLRGQSTETMDSKQVRDFLRTQAINATDPKRYNEALELWNWIRMMEGVNSELTAGMRAFILNKATGLNRILGNRGAGAVERAVMEARPIDVIRSGVFKTFLALRPARQLLLQSAQIAFLSPLDPGYVASTKIFRDAYNLRRAIGNLNGFDTGRIDIRASGYKPSDWDALVRTINESGLLESVDVHSMQGGARKFHKQGLAVSVPQRVANGVVKPISAGVDFMQRYGFDLGESNNLVFTYLLAARRYANQNGIDGFAKFTTQDWDKVLADTSNMALGMIRPNELPYQRGMLAMGTQFMSFGHKALVTMLGANPSVGGLKNALQISGGMFLLYGANIFGVRDQVYNFINRNGGENLPGEAKDFLAGGAIDYVFNNLMDELIEDWKDIDVGGTFAPGPNVSMVYSNWLEGIFKDPIGTIALGPSGTVGSRILEGVEFAVALRDGAPLMPASEKFRAGANEILKGTIPMYNDVWQSYFAWKMNEWYTQAGEPSDLRPTMNTLIARGLLGVRSREEIEHWALRDIEMDFESELNGIVRDTRDNMTKILNLYTAGEIPREEALLRIRMARSLMEDIEPEVLEPWLERVVKPDNEQSILEQLAEFHTKGIADPAVIARIQDAFPDLTEEEISVLVQMHGRLRDEFTYYGPEMERILDRNIENAD